MDELILIIVHKAAAEALKPLCKSNITLEVLLSDSSQNCDDVGQFKYRIKIHHPFTAGTSPALEVSEIELNPATYGEGGDMHVK